MAVTGMFNSEWFRSRMADAQAKRAPLGSLYGSSGESIPMEAARLGSLQSGGPAPMPMGMAAGSRIDHRRFAAPNKARMGRLGMVMAPQAPPVTTPQPVGGRMELPAMVRLTSPDGSETRDVPAEMAEFYLSRGARRVS